MTNKYFDIWLMYFIILFEIYICAFAVLKNIESKILIEHISLHAVHTLYFYTFIYPFSFVRFHSAYHLKTNLIFVFFVPLSLSLLLFENIILINPNPKTNITKNRNI